MKTTFLFFRLHHSNRTTDREYYTADTLKTGFDHFLASVSPSNRKELGQKLAPYLEGEAFTPDQETGWTYVAHTWVDQLLVKQVKIL